MLCGAGFLDEAHAAMHLDAFRGNLQPISVENALAIGCEQRGLACARLRSPASGAWCCEIERHAEVVAVARTAEVLISSS